MIWTLLALPLALLLSPLCAGLAGKLSLIDRPRDGRFHHQATPKLGGLAILLAVAPVLVDTALRHGFTLALAVGGGAAFLVGLRDDARALSAPMKLAGQTAASLASCLLLLNAGTGADLGLGRLPGPLFIAIGTLWLVTLQNAVNLLDNMDGIAAGVGMVALLALIPHLPADSTRYAAGGLALACAGFLPYNIARPSRLFLGDAGSLLLGHALGFFSLVAVGTTRTVAGAVAPVVVVLIPLADITFVTVTRLREGRSLAAGGRDHTTHRLYVRLGSVARTRRAFWGVGVFLGLAAWGVRRVSTPVSVLLLAGILLAMLAAGRSLAGIRTPNDRYGN